MIVVLSYDYYEQGTEYVIDWLVYLKADFIKITMRDFFRSDSDFELDITERKLYYKGNDVSEKINVIFYRRLFTQFSLKSDVNNLFKDQIESEVTDEAITLIHYLFSIFHDKVWLPPPYSANVNKLTMLNHAQAAGLKVPNSKVINNKKQLQQFFELSKLGIITKPIAKSSYYIVGKHTYFPNVNVVNQDTLDELPDHFFPSLFQEKVEKDFEIRVFYLDGQFYNVAHILTTDDSYVDIKLNSNPNNFHWVTYKLPDKIEQAIDAFMKSIRLNTGSLDIIKDKTGNYYFLEVNPVGQYGHGSHIGNFNLEKIIAEWLIKQDTNYGSRN